VKCDSLTFSVHRKYRRPLLGRLPDIFRYAKKVKSVLAIRREIVEKHLQVPPKNSGKLRRFWAAEMTLLKRLLEDYPNDNFWLRIDFKPVPYGIKYGNRLQFLKSFAQFFSGPFKDQLKQKYAEFHFEIKRTKEPKVYKKKFGKDVRAKRKPRTIKDFLNG
jgi:hypothetical protein